MTRIQKENDFKFQLRFVKCYITFSAEQISQMPFYCVLDVYYKNQP